MARRSIALAVTVLGMLFAASVAQADTGDIIEQQHNPATAEDGFQAGTCLENKEAAPPNKFCSPETPGIFFEKAGGHPPVGFTQYIVKHILPEPAEPARQIPVGILKEIRVDLPVGLTVNPQATPQCEVAVFEANETLCPAGSIVGKEELTLATVVELNPNPLPFGPSPLPSGFQIPPNPTLNTEPPLYNLVPVDGEPARFGFKIGPTKAKVFLRGTVDWAGDYHQGFFIAPPPPSNPALRSLRSRLVNIGTSGNGTYISNPTTCVDPATGAYSTFLRAQSTTDVTPGFPDSFTPWEAALPTGVEQDGCDTIPFEPKLVVTPGTTEVDSPAAPTVTAELPFDPDPSGQEQSHVRNANVTLPLGMGLNPSASPSLEACSTEQFGKGTENPVTCPVASKIGTAEVETPPLPPGSLKGDVYLAQQQGFNPESGDMYRIFINPKSDRYGVDVRLVGNVKANALTGQLTTTLAETPQVPFESVTLKFDPAKGVLTSPPTCAKQTTSSAMEPWARPGTQATPSAEFTLSSVPGGGSCPTTLASRKFAPPYTAGTASSKAGAYSPFRVHIGRPDGEQELKVVNVTLPKGLTGKLAGIPYCSEAAIAAAAAAAGKTELAAPSCSSASMIGTASTESGTGAAPLKLGGKAYLAGPYKGAPLSMVVVTPAVSGPFDLGTVVVRVALNVNPETAQINAVSDTIPDVYGGVKLDLRSIDVDVNRSQFMINPTNCSAQATSGAIAGGGADPTNPAAFSSYAVSAPFQANECKSLAFKPKFHTRLTGPTKRDGNPRLRAILEAKSGNANIARTALTLPHSLFLDQSHIGTVCTRPQLASQTCPKASIYGKAEAITPLLDNKLKGNVYLVSNPSHELPDLLADLRGQVNVQLRGVIGTKRGGLKTVFNGLPDVPVKKFILNMSGGDKSLLVNSENTCKASQLAVLNIKGQNGKLAKSNKFKLNMASCGKKK
ncbi:MAG: hypothetical protein JJE35_06825 [Thermoleophilia bacterium]|nr:hypothetical protein [Thermoleophilia bacterium]